MTCSFFSEISFSVQWIPEMEKDGRSGRTECAFFSQLCKFLFCFSHDFLKVFTFFVRFWALFLIFAKFRVFFAHILFANFSSMKFCQCYFVSFFQLDALDLFDFLSLSMKATSVISVSSSWSPSLLMVCLVGTQGRAREHTKKKVAEWWRDREGAAMWTICKGFFGRRQTEIDQEPTAGQSWVYVTDTGCQELGASVPRIDIQSATQSIVKSIRLNNGQQIFLESNNDNIREPQGIERKLREHQWDATQLEHHLEHEQCPAERENIPMHRIHRVIVVQPTEHCTHF